MNKYDRQIIDNTLVDQPRLDVIYNLVKETSQLPGAIAEVGVYKGGTAYLLCQLAYHIDKPVYLFDTFEGMPEVDPTKDMHHTGDFGDTSLEAVTALMSPFPRVSIHKGVFPKQMPFQVWDKEFSLVHLDVDIYSSVSECLKFFYPRMVRSGVIIIDDYLEWDCPGAKLAADEFAKMSGVTIVPTTQSQAIIRF